MGIQKITIEKFTIFENIQIDFCDGINIFIGENGTGKTHLLKLLYAAHLPRLENPPSLNSVFGEDCDIRMSVESQTTDVPSTCTLASPIGANVNPDGTQSSLYQYSDYSKITVASHNSYNPVYIPAKDMLTHGRLEKDYAERNLPFDRTLIDILNKAGVSTVRNLSGNMIAVVDSISKIIGGAIVYKNDRYYVKKASGTLIGFDMEAEGFKKLGLIYRLVETGYFKKGSVLLWDEPEANINPKRIPDVVDILLELARQGVQVFLATHDYMFAKYFEVKREKADNVIFHTLYKKNDFVDHESNENFRDLKMNPIIDAFDELMDDVLGKNLGD